MRSAPRFIVFPVTLLLLAGCEATSAVQGTDPGVIPGASLTDPWGPEYPPFNLEAVLRSTTGDAGFGLVRFRQPNGGGQVIYLDTWVRDLAPGTSYRLQRAVDQVIDGICTSASGWLTLGDGLTPLAIVTDDRGTGRAALSRDLATLPTGARFDIHFRIIEDASGAVVLQSGCYEYVISQ